MTSLLLLFVFWGGGVNFVSVRGVVIISYYSHSRVVHAN